VLNNTNTKITMAIPNPPNTSTSRFTTYPFL